jgi:arginase family enzyme
MLEEFLQPAEQELFSPQNFSTYTLGSSIERSTHPEGMNVAIVGVNEDRGSIKNIGCAEAPDVIRKQLFSLSQFNTNTKIIDLGNIQKGETIRDTYVALSKVVNELIKMKILPVIIGGSHDLTCGQFSGYEGLNRMINVSVIDNTIDLQREGEVAAIDDERFLLDILSYEPSLIFNYHQIGYQTHLASNQAIELLNKLQFETYRLGLMRAEIIEIEPVLRGTNLLSFDMSAIRFSDAPANANATPNGIFAEEACQLSRYAGQSDLLDSFGIYGCNPSLDRRNQTSQLAASIIWYFIDGFNSRKNDYPSEDDTDYTKYTIHFKENKYEMNFWKSKKSDRWWMEVPTGIKASNHKKHHLLPCSYKDYQMACQEELPERWIKAFHKLS